MEKGCYFVMNTSWKHMTQRVFVTLSFFGLVVLLTACGGVGSNSSATPTAQTQAPTATPTVASTPIQQVKTYTGTDFTIQYPADWKAQTNSAGVSFTDALQTNTVTIVVVPNPGGTVSAADELKLGMAGVEKTFNISDAKPVDLPATTTLAGETWQQAGITGTVKANGVSAPGKLIGLAVNRPANSPTTKAFEIYYGGLLLTFDQENQMIFQPMLQSFKFTA